MDTKIEKININVLFKDKYIIPIYQRKYAWTEKEINMLLDDIFHAEGSYYLGTLIVDNNGGKYSVIDGQQRLTTLYLLILYLKMEWKYNVEEVNEIKYEARQKYDNALRSIYNTGECDVAEIRDGYKCIKEYFFNGKNAENIKNNIEKILNKTFIVRVQVPKNIDLNAYFETMNTRGEQLEKHHIAKVRFISKMTNELDKKIVATVWDACSNMDTYLQKNFKPSLRSVLFNEDLSEILYDKDKNLVDDLWSKFSKVSNDSIIERNSIEKIIDNKVNVEIKKENNLDDKDKESAYRFASILTFPNFLLHVSVLTDNKDENVFSAYDDKKLLENLQWHMESEERVKKFICNMFRCRFLYDKYIVKRDFQDNDDSELVLKKYKKYNDGTNFINTFQDNDEDKEQGYTYNRLRILQSILRITYTSPRNMQWITEVLRYLNKEKNIEDNSTTLKNITNILEKYCIDKINSYYGIDRDSDECSIKNKMESKKYYDNIERIVFTYLDYILYRDDYNNVIKKLETWKVVSRNSVEHFYPQNPVEIESQDELVKWQENNRDNMHSFGNLSLITSSGNSKLSNELPKNKILFYDNKNIINQSLKLKIMADITRKEGWTVETMKKHEEEMFKILVNEVTRKKDDKLICNENNKI